MNKKIKNIFFLVAANIIAGLLITGCDNEDFTGQSTLIPTSPSLSISPGFSSPVTLTENDSVFEFTVSLSEPQLVDVRLYVKKIDGTATADDYELTGSLDIPAGATSTAGSIKILSDDIIEETETLTIQIGDQRTANATIEPVTLIFNINNLTSDDLNISMTWESNVNDAIGLDLPGDEVADLRLLIIDSEGNVLDDSDGGSYENYTINASEWEDGEYFIATNIYSTIDAGDFNTPIDLDIALDFYQLGIINHQVLSFPKAMTNEYVCENFRVQLAKITKSGSSYDIQEDLNFPSSPLSGQWLGNEMEFVIGYESQVEVMLGCELLIKGLGFGFLEDPNFWGEEIISGGAVPLEVDFDAGTVTISEQPYLVTLYNGAEYPYVISGSGTIDMSGEYPTMTIEYDLIQDGFSLAEYVFGEGYMDTDVFVATLTLDPNGLPTEAIKSAKIIPQLVKPNR